MSVDANSQSVGSQSASYALVVMGQMYLRHSSW